MSYVLVSSICYSSHKRQQLAPQHRLAGKFLGQCFQADSLVLGTSLGLLACLILQYWTISFEAT
jgi:hypothetical protein